MKDENIDFSAAFTGCTEMILLGLGFKIRNRKAIILLASFFVAVLSYTAAANLEAQSAVVTLESQVKGNQEQPNILSIVPWKQADDFGRIDQSIDLSVDDVFQHLDREEFSREYDFYQHHLALEKRQIEQQNND